MISDSVDDSVSAKSISIAIIDKPDNLSCDMVLRRYFFISFNLENDLSAPAEVIGIVSIT